MGSLVPGGRRCALNILRQESDKYYDVVTPAPRSRRPHKVSTPALALLMGHTTRAYAIFIRKRSINCASYRSKDSHYTRHDVVSCIGFIVDL